jgi:NADH:ubiquinone oxidoreductase subunit F (NADH-binding)
LGILDELENSNEDGDEETISQEEINALVFAIADKLGVLDDLIKNSKEKSEDMNEEEVIQKLKDANLFGKGGAAFPTADKWEGVLKAKGEKKYIIVNSSEGEMGLFKDLYIWRNHIDKVFGGINYAIKFLDCPVEVYIHINQHYLDELKPQLFKYINDYKWTGIEFHLSVENPSYIGGEASALINIIETGVAQPRPRTKFRTIEKGLFQMPTMMNNVETFYDVCRILDGDYDNCRFIGIWGDGIEKKVVRNKVESSVADVLKINKITFDFNYIAQIGGSASGAVYNKEQLKNVIMDNTSGAGGIEIFDLSKRNFLFFLKRLGNFYAKESCGKCLGKTFSTSLNEKIQSYNNVEDVKIEELLPFIEDMNKKTFCKLCKSFKTPFITYCNNVLGKKLS